MPDTIPWDPTLSANPDAAAAINRGCPVGYFAQLVAPGDVDALPGPTASVDGTVQIHAGNAVRCRLLSTSTPATISSESGVSAGETVAIFTSALRETAGQVGGAVGSAFAALTSPVLWLAIIGALVLWKRR